MNALRLLRKLTFLSPRKRLEWYPPFFFMRVKILEMQEDWSKVVIRLPLNVFSKNMGDSMFGGYMASLADPIAALACVKRFPDYSVWTRAMNIDFVSPGNSDLELRFEFDEALYQKIEKEIKENGRSTPTFEYGFYRSDGKMCAKVINTVAIRPDNYSPDSKSAYK
jgi:acyl-coenzyme A thioesterase PaaI-like protein